jgi:quercetin dioxygenase-like cupin family protein
MVFGIGVDIVEIARFERFLKEGNDGLSLFPANDSAHFSGATVTFEPGARSAWHIHPAGQHLLVTAGVGRTQEWGGPIVEIKPGDVIWCPPGVKHWHGASPTTAMTHISLTGTIDGKNVEWMEKVTDEQYNGK